MNDSQGTEGSPGEQDVRVIAFYLPQFHPIPENDLWWGEGFTEWTNVRKARPNFPGHYQPHVPGELGYYDLRDPAVRDRQADLARRYGIHGFCYYYYWFNGKRLLERPLDDLLASGRPDFPFCVCWANENWTRRWDGLENDILIAQRYSLDDSREFIHSLFPLFRDKRYIRVDGAPLLLIYKATLIPELAKTVAMWRDECRRAGLGEIYAVGALTTSQGNLSVLGLDAAVEFPPHGHMTERIDEKLAFTNPRFGGMVFSLRNYVGQLLTSPRPEFKLFRGLLPSWDNTARRQDKGTIFTGSSPELFEFWLEQAVQQTRVRHRGDERMLFINAWNEWGEGCHLEPDQRHGRAYLEAVASALAAPSLPPAVRPSLDEILARAALLEGQGNVRRVRSPGAALGLRRPPRVSVVMPAYNHDRFVRSALDSVVVQTFDDLEIIVIDDGSTDGTGTIVDAFAAQCTDHAVTVVHQPNEGAHAAINHGLALATGDFVAVINSDDSYFPRRLERLVAALAPGTDLAFSDVAFIGDDDASIDNVHVNQLRQYIDDATTFPNLLYPLIEHNITTSTGNLLFRRSLLRAIGGFAPLRMCHDWDFVLAATYATRLAFVREPMYRYRVHRGNTFTALSLRGQLETEQVLQSFFAGVHHHPWFDAEARTAFLGYARKRRLGGFVPVAPAREDSARSQLTGA